MNQANDTPQSLESVQLLPPRFYAHQRARRVLCAWAFVLLLLTTVMGAVLVPVWVRGRRIRSGNSRLAAEAAPLLELKRKTTLLEIEHQRQSKWVAWVESAKPDDSLLQAVAAVAQATDPAKTAIQIEFLDVQLPLEYPAKFPQAPRWAAPHLNVTATVHEATAAREWVKRINNSPRIEDAAIKLMTGRQASGTVQVTATPRATRVLP